MSRDPIAVAMSGGIDSSVACRLLQRAGEAVFGATMVLHPGHWVCAEVADQVCAQLAVEHRVFDFSEEFKALVLDRYAASYLRGLTPNPCVLCNAFVKFGRLLDGVMGLGARAMATGHYVCTAPSIHTGRTTLHRPPDGCPDETYFLYRVRPDLLDRLVFPLGGMTKEEVRRLGKELGLPNWNRPSSQDACFAAIEGEFLARRRWTVFQEEGRYLGMTVPLSRVTVGQRKGLGLGLGHKAFVIRIEPQTAKLIVGGEDSLYRRELVATEMVWSAGGPPGGPVQVQAKARYNQIAALADVRATSREEARVHFREPQRSLTCGQSVVLYEERELLGGGIISEVLP